MKNLTIDIEKIIPPTKLEQKTSTTLDTSKNSPKTLISLLELEVAFAQYEGIFESLEEVLEELW